MWATFDNKDFGRELLYNKRREEPISIANNQCPPVSRFAGIARDRIKEIR